MPESDSDLSHFLLRRALGVIPTLLIIIALSFLVMRLAPGGPFDAEKALSPEIRANLDRAYGLDRPLPVQFARYLTALVHGDLGPSLRLRDQSVSELLAVGLPVSLTVGALALLVALAAGVPLGVAAGLARGTGAGRLYTIVTALGGAVPVFVLAPLLALSFGLWLGWLPVAGYEPGRWRDLVLPVLALAWTPVAYVARLMRASISEVMAESYIAAARARGLPERWVIWRYALPAAGLPVLSYLGATAAAVLTGSLVVESVFGLPGVGRHLVQGALDRDYTLVMGVVIVYALLIVALNLAVDILYGVLDPRLRHRAR
jgi:oligopeptide transport system permease protein